MVTLLTSFVQHQLAANNLKPQTKRKTSEDFTRLRAPVLEKLLLSDINYYLRTERKDGPSSRDAPRPGILIQSPRG